jgi:hypothetical protein
MRGLGIAWEQFIRNESTSSGICGAREFCRVTALMLCIRARLQPLRYAFRDTKGEDVPGAKARIFVGHYGPAKAVP